MINLTPYALLFTIASIGISETAYLIRKLAAAEKPVCPIGGGCETVLNSKYNTLFGIHNDIMGMMFYVSAATISALLVIQDGSKILVDILSLMLIGGTAMSMALTYLQWRVIKSWCFWCVMSALTIVSMDIVIATIR